jgi:hypothetical protein
MGAPRKAKDPKATVEEKASLTSFNSSDDISLDKEKPASGCMPSLSEFFGSLFKSAKAKTIEKKIKIRNSPTEGVLDAEFDSITKEVDKELEERRANSLPTAGSDDQTPPSPPSKSV